MKTAKIIFHIDLNCFYASCEVAQNEELKGKPIAIAHLDPLYKGIILSPSYEARKFGIKTTMIVRDALKLCHDLIIIEPDMDLYQHYSKLFFDYLHQITSKVEIASIDEGYLDVTDVCNTIHPLELAEKIQKYLLDNYKLPVSIGIGPSKFLAKMASDMKKPLGITVLRKREIDKLLWVLPIDRMLGVGKKTTPKLENIGIKTIGDLANFKDMELLKKTIGEIYAEGLVAHAKGIDETEVINYFTEVSSVSNSTTFDADVYDPSIIKKTLKVISNSVSYRLQKQNLRAYTVGLQIKYHDFKLINRSRGLSKAINDDYEVYQVVEDLFEEYFEQGDMIRLVGVFANRLIEDREPIKQFSIFDDMNQLEKEEEIQKIINNVKTHFGTESINRGYYEYKKKEENYE